MARRSRGASRAELAGGTEGSPGHYLLLLLSLLLLSLLLTANVAPTRARGPRRETILGLYCNM